MATAVDSTTLWHTLTADAAATSLGCDAGRGLDDALRRQRLAEFAGPSAKLYLCDDAGVVETVTIGDMLPYGFEGKILK